MVARGSPVKALAAMFVGLLISCIGIENPAGTPRFTFGISDLLGGIEPIPAMVGMFAVSEVMRAMITPPLPPLPKRMFGSIMAGQIELTKKYPWPLTRGSIIGVLPGAGADIAAWVSYAMSKRLSKEREKFGTGHPEGSSRRAPATMRASPAAGFRHSSLAFREIRSPRSRSASSS